MDGITTRTRVVRVRGTTVHILLSSGEHFIEIRRKESVNTRRFIRDRSSESKGGRNLG